MERWWDVMERGKTKQCEKKKKKKKRRKKEKGGGGGGGEEEEPVPVALCVPHIPHGLV